jgi:hypothetical protein
MRQRNLFVLLAILTLGAVQSCATAPLQANMRLIPLQEVSLKAIFEENEGLEITRENARELRDFYRGGVQKKAKAEEELGKKGFQAAMQLYLLSNDFFSTLLEHSDHDSAEYNLFEGTNILFFPNLLVADNHLKMGRIDDAMGRKRSARRNWNRALTWVKQSLKCERTEWGLTLQEEILSLLDSKKD